MALQLNLAKCPKCDGTALLPLTEKEKAYSWNKGKETKDCDNCGGQTMFGKATGVVRKNPATGLGCLHEYTGRSSGRSLATYTCKHCESTHQIDSGD